jgi:DNA-binding transcriptional regulator YbjK
VLFQSLFGSTTYHYATLDDLLAAAIVEAKKATDAELAAWAGTLGPDTDLARSVADYVLDALTHHWGGPSWSTSSTWQRYADLSCDC